MDVLPRVPHWLARSLRGGRPASGTVPRASRNLTLGSRDTTATQTSDGPTGVTYACSSRPPVHFYAVCPRSHLVVASISNRCFFLRGLSRWLQRRKSEFVPSAQTIHRARTRVPSTRTSSLLRPVTRVRHRIQTPQCDACLINFSWRVFRRRPLPWPAGK